MMNRKGQALIEFILIMPVLLWILFAIVDIGNIIYQKYNLENDLDIISDMYKLNNQNDINNYISDKKIELSYNKSIDYTKINISKDVKVNTLLLNNIIGNKYHITTSKTIYSGDNNE